MLNGENFYNDLSEETKAEIAEKGISKENVIEGFNVISGFFDRISRAINTVIPTIQAMAKACNDFSKQVMESLPKKHKRVVHLALHGKRLVRKKNLKRVEKILKKGGIQYGKDHY